MRIRFLLAATAAALAPSVASAQQYGIASNFGGTMFQYGYGNGGVSFTTYGAPTTCGGFLTCYNRNGSLPEVIGNTTDTDYQDGGGVVPANSVYFHPGSGTTDADSIIRFIAPTAGNYAISGLFSRQNPTNGAGDGVRVSVFSGATLLYTNYLAAGTLGSSISYGSLSASLLAGGTLDFVVNNGTGGNGFDGTGVDATITSAVAPVPEPATWAMMILGFGAVGTALRRRKTTVSVRYA